MEFKGKVALITGAGGGLGRAYALYLASLGASVIVNDIGGTLEGKLSSMKENPADKVVAEIRAAGGVAVADKHNITEEPDMVVQTAISNFGRLDILINNAGIIRDRSFTKMTPADWNAVINVHLHGSFLVTKAAWPVMVRQKYGRILMTSSAAGIYGNFGQANYSAAKMALVGFTRSLALEGQKYNITCNAIAPLAATRISETALSSEILALLKPEAVAPIVAYLVHEFTVNENGSLFETAGGLVTKLRYQRSPGLFINMSQEPCSLISDLLGKISQLDRFETRLAPTSILPASATLYPRTIRDVPWVEFAEANSKVPIAKVDPKSYQDFLKDRVAIITGAGSGLGRAYALFLSSLGASILINDLNQDAANQVLKEISSRRGKAIVNGNNIITEGPKIVQHAIKAFGKVDILINNAGVLQDVSFSKQSAEQWKKVIDVHLGGTFSLCHAIWPVFTQQKHGNIINTTSAVALYGNFGQTNYAAAKAGIIGLSKTLALEGARSNIMVNVLAPNAGTAMTATVMPAEIIELLKPQMIAPLVAILASKEHCPITGAVIEAGSGWFSAVRVERGQAVQLSPSFPGIKTKWAQVDRYDGSSRFAHPKTAQESLEFLLSNLSTKKNTPPSEVASPSSSSSKVISAHTFSYTERDLILYALSIGCTQNQLPWVYEGDTQFQSFPTFAVIPGLAALFEDQDGPKWMDSVPKFQLSSLLHGEQKLEIFSPIPAKSTVLESQVSIKNMQQKGANLVVTLQVDTKVNNDLLFTNETTLILRNVSMETSSRSSSQTLKTNSPPMVGEQQIRGKQNLSNLPLNRSYTSREDQAALYRLNGDRNPLHIDPSFAKMAGFEKPILHGLCTFGIAARLIMEEYGEGRMLTMIKGRFSRAVIPGETLQLHSKMHDDIKGGGDSDKIRRISFYMDTRENASPALVGGEAVLVTKKEPTPSKHKQVQGQGKAIKLIEQGWEALSGTDKKELVSKFNSVLKFEIDSQDPVWLVLKAEKPGILIGQQGSMKADLVLKLDEPSLLLLIEGKLSPQQAFMKGKVKITGKMSLAMNLEVILKKLKRSSSSSL